MNLNALLDSYMAGDTLEEKQKFAIEFMTAIQPLRIVIYGAGAVGRSLLHSLGRKGIRPLFFVDRRWEECGFVDGMALRSPETLREVNTCDTLVIMAINAEVIREFNQEPVENIRKYCPEAAVLYTGIHVNSLLRFADCFDKLNRGEIFDLAECLDCGAETELCRIYQEYLRRIAPGSKRLAKRPSKKFDWFGYIMGQHCSLKCKDCCECVPYFENPVFSEAGVILSDCEKIAASCSFIRYIELVGGEPFLHPQFRQVLEGLLRIENVGYIKVFTNGTVVPQRSLLEFIKNPRIVIDISNYTAQAKGRLLENIYRTMNLLNENGIRYVYSESKEWTDWGGFHDRGRTEEDVRNNASHCFCYNCHRAFQGKLFRCPHQYAGIQQGKMKLIEGEYVDLNCGLPEELARKLDAFEELPFTDGCRRCDMPFDCPVVPAGIQLD